MAKKKYYAVKKGLTPGVYETWDECRSQVDGVSGAVYKSFAVLEEAEQFAGRKFRPEQTVLEGSGKEDSVLESSGKEDGVPEGSGKEGCVPEGSGKEDGVSEGSGKEDGVPEGFGKKDRMPEGSGKESSVPDAPGKKGCVPESCCKGTGEAHAYVDGSYRVETGEYSCGIVLFADGEELHFCKKGEDAELAAMRNVAGEIMGAEIAMREALRRGMRKLVIYHDYQGIAAWCLGEWKTNKDGTKAYKAFFDSIKSEMQIQFIKVKGHSGDTYNEVADSLAKSVL